MKKVLIYEFLPQVGGGQRVAFQMAEALAQSDKYEVAVMTPRKIPLKWFQSSFGVVFDKVRLMTPDAPVEEWDVFINAEYAYWEFESIKVRSLFEQAFIIAHDAHPLGRKPDFMEYYDAVLPSSEYGKQKLQDERWPLKARVLRPPVYPDATFEWDKKVARILVVARFDQFRNNNSLPTVIKAFQKACDDGLENHELALAGWVLNPTIYRQLWDLAQIGRYPIRFAASPSQVDLTQIYRSSRYILNVRGIDSPKPSSAFSHEALGLVTIEGVAHGCVPIVHGFAGHMEVVPFPSLWIDKVEDISSRLREIAERWTDDERKDIWECCDRHVRGLFTREAFLNDFEVLLGEFE